jgi:hypothetical protein
MKKPAASALKQLPMIELPATAIKTNNKQKSDKQISSAEPLLQLRKNSKLTRLR